MNAHDPIDSRPARLSTYGPCARCDRMAAAVEVRPRIRLVLHRDHTIAPCPVRAGEMPEIDPAATARAVPGATAEGNAGGAAR